MQVRSGGRTGDRDQKITARLGHLTGLALDDSSPCLNGAESGCLWKVADGDRHEVQWARRLLHRSEFNSVCVCDGDCVMV